MGIGFQSSEQDDSVLAEINVTPLVDVMLVLLIIFMVAAPMLHQGIKVELPSAQAQALPHEVKDPIVLSITREGMVYLKDQPVHASQLVNRLQPLVKARAGQMVFLKGDREVPYGKVVEVLDLLRRGGIVDVGVVTEPETTRRR